MSPKLRSVEDRLKKADKVAEELAKTFGVVEQKSELAAFALSMASDKSDKFASSSRRVRSENDKTRSSFDKLRGSIRKTVEAVPGKLGGMVSGAVGGVFDFAKYAALGTAAAGGVLTAQAMKLSSDAEQSMIGFTTMLGSADKASKFLADLTEFANTTPFELPQLRDSSKRLLAFGFSAEKVLPMLTAVGNAASGLGLGQDGIDRITLALGQMQAKAKVSGDEIECTVSAIGDSSKNKPCEPYCSWVWAA